MPRKRNEGEAVIEKEQETKADKFRRLANRRVPNVVRAIRALCNLGNRANYHYTAEQVEVMRGRIGKALDRLQAAFAEGAMQEDGDGPIF